MATKLAISMQELEESKRHNYETEFWNRVDQTVNMISKTGKFVTDLIGAIKQDPEWYKRANYNDNQYQFPWSLPYEDQIDVTYQGENGQNERHTYLNPNFMVINWIPTIGTGYGTPIGGASHASPISRAITMFFTDESAANFGTSGQYDPTDYFQWILGFDSVVTAITEAYRVYRLVKTYKEDNWEIPADMITALGWNFEDLRQNQIDFYNQLETLVKQVNSIACPAGLSYMDKHICLANNIYRDQPLRKTHYYIFKCDCFFQYDELNSRLLRKNPAFDSNNTYAQNLQIIYEMIAALQKGTGKQMSGDTKRWCSNLLQVQLGDASATMEFNDDNNMLLQIHNMDLVGPLMNADNDCEIHQSSDGEDLYQGYANPTGTQAYGLRIDNSKIAVQASNETFATESLLRCYEDEPSVDTMIDATRLKAPREWKTLVAADSTTYQTLVVKACGSEVCTTAYIYFRNINQAGLTFFDVWDYRDMNPLVANTYGKYWNMLTRFNYLPLMRLMNGTGPNTAYPFTFWQAGNFVRYPLTACIANHRTALMSELGSMVVSSFGKKSGVSNPKTPEKKPGSKKSDEKKDKDTKK